jgi:hypothetical protein
MAIQPVTYRPVQAVTPVKRRPEEEAVRKVTERPRPGRGHTPDRGTGETIDTWA